MSAGNTVQQPVRLAVRDDGVHVIGRLVVEGHEEKAVELLRLNSTAAKHPGVYEAFVIFCRVLMRAVVEDALGKGSVAEVAVQQPRRPS